MSVDYHTTNGLQAFKDYIALKMHFTAPIGVKKPYDYFHYNGKTNATLDSYKKRKDVIYFEMIGKKPEFFDFLVYNIATFDKTYPKDLATNKKHVAAFEKMKSEVDAFSYNLRSELTSLGVESVSNLADLFKIPPGQTHPKLVKYVLNGKMSMVTACALNAYIPYTVLLDHNIKETMVWPRMSHKIKKLTPFLKIDEKKVAKALKGFIDNE